MKTKYNLLKTVAVALLFSFNSWSQVTITQWNFNGTSATTVPGTGTSPTANEGSGTAELIGGITATFGSGIATGGSSDPVLTMPSNYGWNTTSYAASGTEDKQRGVQFNVSTVGFQGITFRFDQRLSNSSNNTYVVQYNANRLATPLVWVNAQTFTFTPAAAGTGDRWYNLRSVNLSSVAILDNNPNVAFRITSSFDPIIGNYTSSTMSPIVYLTTGTVRFDMVTVLADTVLAVSQFDLRDNNFILYPNPSCGGFVNFNQPQDVDVFDTIGKLVLSAKNILSIDTKTFKTGVYFVRTDTGITKKLIVK